MVNISGTAASDIVDHLRRSIVPPHSQPPHNYAALHCGATELKRLRRCVAAIALPPGATFICCDAHSLAMHYSAANQRRKAAPTRTALRYNYAERQRLLNQHLLSLAAHTTDIDAGSKVSVGNFDALQVVNLNLVAVFVNLNGFNA